MILTSTLVAACLFLVFLCVRWINHDQERRLRLPHFKSKHLVIGLTNRGMQVQVRKVKKIDQTEFGTGKVQTIELPGKTLRFSSENITQPHGINFHSETKTQTKKWESTPDRLEGYAIHNRGISTVSARVISGREAGSFDHQAATGQVSVSFKKFVGEAEGLSHYTLTMGLAEAKTLLRWVLRHREHFDENISGWETQPLQDIVTTYKWPTFFNRVILGHKSPARA